MNHFVKTGLKILTSVVVLLVIVAASGIGYSWYVSQHSPQDVKALSAPVAPTGGMANVAPRPKPANDAVVGITVENVTSPVAPGQNASIMVKTNPGATCSISVVYGTNASKDSGLIDKKADEYGLAEWTWSLEPSVPLGNWPVKVTCANAKKSAVVQNDLQVKAAKDIQTN